ncbi:hypothetical protein [Nonomuraea sp. NPDC050783]|uniref:hypothetical protein n=1 Tax=Nonomuraea sp. NPDC050783 TaxID=3154634 RepID=UPI00346736AF
MTRAFIEIRATTHIVKRELPNEDLESAQAHVDRIRMIADICHNLPADFIPGSEREREQRAMDSLKWHLGELEPGDRSALWVQSELDDFGYDYRPLLPQHVRDRLTQR